MKKIVFLVPSMSYGGAERVISILSNEWVKLGYEVAIISMDKEKREVYPLNDKIRLKFVDEAHLRTPSDCVRLIKRVRKELLMEKPDIVLSFINSTAAFACLALRGTGIPVIFSERNDPYSNINGWKAKLFQRIALHDAAHIVFQTEGARAYYKAKIRDKSSIILNPIEIKSNIGTENRRKEKKIVSVGRLCAQKNQKLLIDAFEMVQKNHPEYKLEIYGEGELRTELEEQIKCAGLSDFVILPGVKQNVFDYINAAAVFVFSSDYEGLPNALIEAMALGMPCVSTDCSPGGAREIIQNYENGILVPCGDKEKMAVAINFLLDNKEEAEKMGKEARKIRERLDAEKIAKRWITLLDEVAGGKANESKNK